MPSYCSRKSAEATGKVTSVGVTVPVPHLTIVPTLIWRLALVLAGRAGDADHIAQADGVRVAALEDEDAVRGGRVAVAGRVLDEEAAQRGRGAFVVAHDHALGGAGAGQRHRRAAALDGRDGSVRLGADDRIVVGDGPLALTIRCQVGRR